MKKYGFTLVEVLITIAIIGVVLALMMPMIDNLLPDKGEARAKKAYNTLTNVVDSLVNNPDIYPDGVLASPTRNTAGTVLTADQRNIYFCEQFADAVNVSGGEGCGFANTLAAALLRDSHASTADGLDSACVNTNATFLAYLVSRDLLFKTTDGVYWYGMFDDFTTEPAAGSVDNRYVVVCTYVDAGNGLDDIYSFGVRRDGKIMLGKRMQDILDKED